MSCHICSNNVTPFGEPNFLLFFSSSSPRKSKEKLHTNVTNNVTSSSGLQVTGKDRALFFKRPVLQMSYVMPLPHIRYTRELSLSVDDIARNDSRKKRYEDSKPPKLYEDSFSRGHSSRMSRISLGTQTDFRESETQTLPCSLNNKKYSGELGAMSMLKYGKGLPVQTSQDLEYVDQLREQHDKEANLPPKGDPLRPILQRKIIENKYQIEMNLSQKSGVKTKNWKVHNMKNAVDEYTDQSAMQLEQRMDRIWKQKQKEKDERMRKIRKIHAKEIKNLEWKCNVKNERLYGRAPDRRRQEFRTTFDKIMQQDEVATPTAGSEVNADLDLTAQQLFGRPRTSGTTRRYLILNDFSKRNILF